MAITPDQKAAFTTTWGPEAVKAGQTLGVSPDILLSQWALESGYGTNQGSKNFNVAGIGGDYNQTRYASPDDFTNAYTALLQNPRYAGALHTSDPATFVAGLKKGGYFGGDQGAYTSAVTSMAGGKPTLGMVAAGQQAPVQPVAPSAPASNVAGTAGPAGSPSGPPAQNPAVAQQLALQQLNSGPNSLGSMIAGAAAPLQKYNQTMFS